EGVVVFEWLHQRPDGELWDAEVHLMSFYSGERQLLQFTLQDITERKRVTEALRKSESFLKETQLIARLGTYTMDIASGRWESSEVLDAIFGIDEDYEKSVEGWGNIIHPDWQKTMVDYFVNEVVGKVTKFDKDYKIVRQNDKTERWVHGIGRLKCNDKNQPVTMLGTIGDITERKLAEETIRTMKLLLEQTFEQSPVPMVLVSMPDAIIRIANPACRDFLLINDEPSLINTKLVDIKPSWLDYDMNGEAGTIESLPLMQSLLGNRTEGIERCIIRKDGSTRYELVHGIPIFDDNGQVIAGYLIMIDITERKLAEMELRKLSQAVQQSPTSVIITDPRGRIEYVNPKARASTGKSVAELTGKNLRILLSNELAEEDFNNLVATVISSGKWQGEIYNQRADGELFWESASISPIINDNGEIIHLLAVKEDITEKKEILNELIDARDKAESASKLKDAFIANISHEIRTPLNGILGMTGIVQESYSRFASEEDHRIFRSIERSSKRLINTVDKILHFSRLQVGDFVTSSNMVHITAVLERLISEYTPFVREKSIDIIFNPEIEDDIVFADETSLYTAFGNLIDNAIKFTDEGTIGISVYLNTQKLLCVDIKDTGFGISEEYLPVLFEPYSQELMGYSRPFEGLGLGLAIVKKLLGLNGASIEVKSKKGVGTEFTVSFSNGGTRRAQAKTAEITGSKSKMQEQPIGTKPVVLVVEDDEVNQLFLEVILQKQCDVKIAPNAGKALDLFLEHDFTIIIMDISLKEGLNGLELTHVIRTGEKNPTVPIIAVTGHALPEDHQKALEAGCNDYLAKPFKGFQLLEKIEKLVLWQ
ncbi:MAG: PAS domain S-box protein, partial [Ignavibacteriales bacterium]|nr:PAS domain S-box protein [Ignavibacteriales bacterium]